MDLTTNYLGLTLESPLVPSASPLTKELDNFKKLEDAGAAAIVMFSLFEEQILQEEMEHFNTMEQGTNSFAEALSYFPEPDAFSHGAEAYLEQIQKAKAAVGVPIIASLNGDTKGGWTDYAKRMQEAGADALELNIYKIPTDPDEDAASIEGEYLDILKAVKGSVTIPVAVKLGPFFTNMANMAKKLVGAGADGLVLFNRFYQPDFDIKALEVSPSITLSRSSDGRVTLNWLALLFGKVQASLAATGGIHEPADVVKMLLAGANVTQLASVLLGRGIDTIKELEAGLVRWMEEHEYESVKQMQGAMSHKNVADPTAFERALYAKALTGYTSF